MADVQDRKPGTSEQGGDGVARSWGEGAQTREATVEWGRGDR